MPGSPRLSPHLVHRVAYAHWGWAVAWFLSAVCSYAHGRSVEAQGQLGAAARALTAADRAAETAAHLEQGVEVDDAE